MSILRFVEDNWSLGRLGDQSFDERAGPLTAMFAFENPTAHAIKIDAKTGDETETSAREKTARMDVRAAPFRASTESRPGRAARFAAIGARARKASEAKPHHHPS